MFIYFYRVPKFSKKEEVKMKVGLLVCDQVKETYRAAFGDYPDMFAALFPDYELVIYNVFKDEFPANVNSHRIYMATGSSHSVYEDLDWIKKTKAFIREIAESDNYFIGVCFGHQLLAEALGGRVAKAPNGWLVGVHQFKIHRVKKWLKPIKLSAHFLLMCQDQVLQMPPNAQRIAGSKACPNAIMQIGKRMLSIQAHPEFSKEYDKALMQSRVERIGAEKVEAGIASLAIPLDTVLFQKWVKRFLRHVW
jgi:GMP synthase-like glutamine amidotransferase